MLAAPLDPAKVDVCAAVPGAAVAGALGGKLQRARPFAAPDGDFARCTYLVAPARPPQAPAAGYVIWLYRPEAYERLLAEQNGAKEAVAGLGDAAVLCHDEDGRWKLRFVRRGRYAAEVTAPDAAAARKLAQLAAETL